MADKSLEFTQRSIDQQANQEPKVVKASSRLKPKPTDEKPKDK